MSCTGTFTQPTIIEIYLNFYHLLMLINNSSVWCRSVSQSVRLVSWFQIEYLPFVWGWFSESLWTDCRRFRSPVCRWRQTDSWLRSGGSLGSFPLSQSGCDDALSWRLKRGEEWHTQVALNLILNLSLTHWEPRPTRLPVRNSALLGPCCVFLAAPRQFSEETVFSLEPLETQSPLHSFSLTLCFTGTCRYIFQFD